MVVMQTRAVGSCQTIYLLLWVSKKVNIRQRSITMVNYQWCRLRPSVLGQDRSEIKKSILVLVLRIWSCLHHWY